MQCACCALVGDMQWTRGVLSDARARFDYNCSFKWTLPVAEPLESDPMFYAHHTEPLFARC
jgi:hypothetical protein